MKFENPFTKKIPILDTNVRINSIDKNKKQIVLIPNYEKTNFAKIEAEYMNISNIDLKEGDEFEFTVMVDYIGGNYFELTHVVSKKKVGFFNFSFL